jgi:hypothetical protein
MYFSIKFCKESVNVNKPFSVNQTAKRFLKGKVKTKAIIRFIETKNITKKKSIKV